MSVPTRPEFPSNSDQTRKSLAPSGDPSDKKKLEPVVSQGGAKIKKPPVAKRILHSIIQEDAKTITEHVLLDILAPGIRDLIANIAFGAINSALYGENRGRRPSAPAPGGTSRGYRVSGGRGGYSAYSSVYTRDDFSPGEERSLSRRARASHDFAELLLASREEAHDILEKLNDQIELYDIATVGDLYNLAGVTATHVDENWGWSSLEGSRVMRASDGWYYLDLPKPNPKKD